MNKTMMVSNPSFLLTRYSLLSRLQNWDDQESWKDFFDTYWRLIYSIAIKSGLTETEAEDVVQEALIRAFKGWDQLALAERQSAWVRRIVVRCALTALQRRQDAAPLPDDLPAAGNLEADLQVNQILQKMNIEHRALLGLAIGEGLSYSEIAEALDIPAGTVASRLHHAKLAFRKAWEGAR